ncbi:TetR/AcrR family transcriptional regulator [Nocardia rhamnosiphila]|uniref:TetR/AcrR family transcriptional regulator n=1 Tax=Nocardia rhamnosiphila TaxID=426716 RepID=UPI0033FD90C6
MTPTEQIATRDKERTRRAILDAAERMLHDRGSKVSLADIAAAAGVTKGGLTHHFPSRHTLILGVFEHGIARMWEEVRAQIDLSENRAGKFTRAYVRALTGGSDYLTHVFNPTGLIGTLGYAAEVVTLYEQDSEKWNAAFAADGLPWPRVLAIRAAAEGLAIAISTPYLTQADLSLARAELLALTEPQ